MNLFLVIMLTPLENRLHVTFEATGLENKELCKICYHKSSPWHFSILTKHRPPCYK